MKIKKEDLLFMLFCIATAIIFASYRCVNGDFIAYNGDFQNYNIYRRLLDGQVQYRDFTNYLGNGMVFMNLPLVSLFRSFGESVFITNFTASIIYSFIIFISFYTIIHNRKKVYVISSITAILAFVILHAGFRGTFYYQYIYDVIFFEELGHSMRTVRAFLPFLLVGIFYIIKHVVKRKNLLLYITYSKKHLAAIYFILGIFTVWSNDFGYSCVICFFIIMLLITVFDEKSSVIRKIFMYGIAIFCTVSGALLAIIFVTHGNISDYIATTVGISDYQFWYYGNMYGKYLTVSEIFRDRKYTALTVIFFIHAICFLIKTIRKEVEDDSICKLFLHSSCYAASLIYVIGSGGHNYAAVEVITYIWGSSFLIKHSKIIICKLINTIQEKELFVDKKWKCIAKIKNALLSVSRILDKNKMFVYIFGMLLLYCISLNMLRINISYNNREKVEKLNVYSVIGSGLEEVAEEIKEEAVFSTYAGALETINDVFQPSGTDYIIHVLGDAQREKYLDYFKQEDYSYVSTLKNEYTAWEYWASRANWYFYRELYLRYEPVKETNFSVIWRKTENENIQEADVKLKWEYVNDTTCRIDVEVPDIEDGLYVDLNLKYKTVWTQERLEKGGLRRVLCVQDGGEQYNNYGANSCYYLREESDGCNIPVYIRNGTGYAYISSNPLSCTRLEGVEISVENIIKEPAYPLHVTYYTDIGHQIAEDGVNTAGTLLKFDNTEYNATILENAGQLEANGEVGIVKSVWRDGNYIYVSLENEIKRSKFTYPNKIEVIKKGKVYTTVNYSDDDWVCGVSRNHGEILLSKDTDIEQLYAIKVGKVTKRITSIKLTENGYCLSLADNNGIQIFAYPQEIELIYKRQE